MTHIWTTISGTEYGWPRLLRLRAYYDGSEVASVDSPLGDFFAVGHGFERTVRSLMVRNLSDRRARNSYWPMPFEKSCRITITNEGSRRVGLYYHVDWEKIPSLPPNTAYFHARYRQALPALTAALKDSDSYVREAAALAIGAHGAGAAAAVPALVAACQAPGQPGSVVRACLYALGAMGKAATPALPALRKLTDPGVVWVVEKTVRDIER